MNDKLIAIWLRLKKISILAPILKAIHGSRFYYTVLYVIERLTYPWKKSKAYFEQNDARIKSIKANLADDKSRKVYDNVIKWRYTRNVKYLRGNVDKEEDQYFDEGIIKFTDEEVFVDCGANIGGGRLTNFLNKLPNKKFKEIIALEPDPINFKKLTQWAAVTGGGTTR